MKEEEFNTNPDTFRFLDPTNDMAFKSTFGDPDHTDRLISLLNTFLKREGDKRIKTVEILSVEALPRTKGGKRSYFDIRCTDERNFQYIVEIQRQKNEDYLKRIQFYACNAYTNQLKGGDNYIRLTPVIILSFLRHRLFDDHIPPISVHSMREETTNEKYLDDISYVFVELPKFKIGELKTLEDYWVDFLYQGYRRKKIPRGVPKEIEESYEVVEMMNWSSEEMWAYKRAMMDEMDERSIYRTAINEGMAKGIEEGIQKGMEMGIAEGIKEGLEQGIERGVREGMEKGVKEGMEKGVKEGMEKGKVEGTKEAKIEMVKSLYKAKVSVDIIIASSGLSEMEVQKIIHSM